MTRQKHPVPSAPRLNHDFTSLLPTELTLSIIKYLKQDIPALRCCRLVSRAWNNIFTPMAFDRTVVFLADKGSPARYRGYRIMHKVHKHVSKHPTISQHIRYIDLRDSRVLGYWENLARLVEAEIFFRVLLSLPNLEQVAYSGPPLIGRVRFDTLPNIKRRSLSSLRLLILNDEHQSNSDRSLHRLVYELLQIFVTIDTLVVARTPRFRSVGHTGTGPSPQTQQHIRAVRAATIGDPDFKPHLIRALELERISLYDPPPNDSASFKRHGKWLKGLQTLKIAKLDTQTVHELSALLQHTPSLRVLDIAKFVSKQAETNHESGLIDLSTCTRLQYVHIYVPVSESISGNAYIWHNLVQMVIFPLGHSNRANPIGVLSLSFMIDRNLWDATIAEPEFEEERYAEFEAGLKLLCTACARARRAGAMQWHVLNAQFEEYNAASGQVTEAALASRKRFKDIWRAAIAAHLISTSGGP